jgi:hypothetical protein
MTNQIILVRPHNSLTAKWLTITDDDLGAINRVDEMFDGFFTDNHEVFILTGYNEFLDWMDAVGRGLEDGDVYQFEAYVRGQIDFLFSPQENEDIISRLINWFMQYEAENQIVNTPEPVENVITIHGKRYKLVELT